MITSKKLDQVWDPAAVIDFAKYKKDNDWHKATRKLDLASLFPEGKTLNSLTDKEKAAVNKLLKLTLGTKD